MARVLVLGSIVAVSDGALLGLALAYQLLPLAAIAVLVGLAGALAVARATPEPRPELRAPVTLGGPLARPADNEQDDESIAASVQHLPVPVVASVRDAA